MWKTVLAGTAALALVGSSLVYAQQGGPDRGPRGWHMSAEDVGAFADARIAAVHAGLKLTADQEKNWPAVETAVRDFAKMRIDRANARINAQRDDSKDAQQKPDDPVARLRERAET